MRPDQVKDHLVGWGGEGPKKSSNENARLENCLTGMILTTGLFLEL